MLSRRQRRQVEDMGHRCHYLPAGPPGENDTQRITIVVAFWDETLMAAQGQPGSGPARVPPWRQQCAAQHEASACPESSYRAGAADVKGNRAAFARQWWTPAHAGHANTVDVGWPGFCRHCTVTAQPQSASQLVKQVALVCPVWVTLEEALTAKRNRQQLDAGRNYCLCAPLPPLMFFLRSTDDIHRIYNSD